MTEAYTVYEKVSLKNIAQHTGIPVLPLQLTISAIAERVKAE